MAIKINFDSASRPETPTFVLSKKNGNQIGILTCVSSIVIKDNLNSPAELTLTINKHLNGKKTNHWRDVSNFRLLYVPEWKKHFEIRVEINEDDVCIKNITATSLCEAELSQLLINMEVNTKDDIALPDYVPTVLYNQDNISGSLLHRMLRDKAQQYKIIHVDDTVKNIQRTFTFSDKSIYDAFQEVAEEIHCLFTFGEESKYGFRTISVYDLESYCNGCKYRGEYTDTCPECGSKDVMEGYGEDTTIFISTENLAEGIVYSTDTDSVKNCFRLEAGDNSMTAAVINASPSGSSYLWYLPDAMKNDMSEGLVAKLDSYDKDYLFYEKSYETIVAPTLLSKYNQLIQKYLAFNENLETVASAIKGFQNLTKIYYDTIDFGGYLQTTLMPTIEMTGTTAAKQAELLTVTNLSPVSVENTSYISIATANSTILGYAKVYIDTSRYRIKVKESTLNGRTWTGTFTVTSYTDEEDTADSQRISIQINDDYENFIRQKIDKSLAKDKNDDFSIVGIFKKSDNDFRGELKKYSLSYLNIFYDACQSCLNILIEQGVADNDKWNSSSDPSGNLYESLYTPYLNKSNYITQEMQLRESEIGLVVGGYDGDGHLLSHGMQSFISEKRNDISKLLDFKEYVGGYWDELSTFRREDVWKNDNYISDGLSNSELFDRAKEFVDAAKKDLVKSATLQHTISTALKNLLVIDSFKSLRKHFSVANWLRLQIDDSIYKLRLISYEIDYDNMDNISVDFSDVVDHLGVLSDIESILNQSQSMSTSYNSTKHQAEKGADSKDTIDNWTQKGLDATLTKIVNSADNQDIVFDRHGLLVRQFEEETNSYSPLQLKIVNGTLVVTDNGWETAKTGVGKFIYLDPKDLTYKTGYGIIANQIVGDIVLSKEVGIYNKYGTMTFNENGLNIRGSKNSFTVDPNSSRLLSLNNGEDPIFYVDEKGKLYIKGDGNGLDITVNGKTEKIGTQIKQTSDSITAEVNRATKAEGKLSTSLKITSDGLSAEVDRAIDSESKLSASLRIQAEQIALKVSKGNVSSQLSVESDVISLRGPRLEVDTEKFKMERDGTTRLIDSYMEVSDNKRLVSLFGGSIYFQDKVAKLDAGLISFNPNHKAMCIGGYGAYEKLELGYWAGNDNFGSFITLQSGGNPGIQLNDGFSVMGKEGFTGDVSFIGEDGFKHYLYIWHGIIVKVK